MKLAGEEFIKQAAALRGQKKFQEAIALIDAQIKAGAIDPDIVMTANLQGFYAAQEAGMDDEARRFAKAIEAEDPNVPSIQDYL
ncbi:hypothetical protein BB934_45730 (plasmid) [Microvirga ossetica]|uniref:Tetratricopeptide repeat protein n=1 Tax=Microvirga ossetica TaxID=1882682 RepID=A0A1B2EZZ9_9HYPH|nr:hypothetical protein [Microvirga ossetica]ANY85522.1 hypothetical protein BB934_45730 [Microvirga ossetica]